jgi:hypothetical protein
VRVSSIEPSGGHSSARWTLYGVDGAAARHDTAEEQARAKLGALLGHFDIVCRFKIAPSLCQ